LEEYVRGLQEERRKAEDLAAKYKSRWEKLKKGNEVWEAEKKELNCQ